MRTALERARQGVADGSAVAVTTSAAADAVTGIAA
jgi:hypothetical protein